MTAAAPAAPERERASFSKFTSALAVFVAAAGFALLEPTAAVAEGSFDARMLQLINDARGADGLAPVGVAPVVASIAGGASYSGCGYNVSGRAVDMGQRGYFSHTIKDCGTQGVFDMLRAANLPYSAAGENIGYLSGVTNGSEAAATLHTAFMNSPGHRANVLNGNFNAVGIGSWLAAPGQGWAGASGAQGVLVTAIVFANLPAQYVATPASVVPPSPSSVVAKVNNGSVTVTWARAGDPAGDPVDAYAVLVFDANGYTGQYATACANCTSVVMAGLTNGAFYAAGVLAHNRAGWSEAAYSGWVAPGTPAAPRSLGVTPGPSQLRATWAAPVTTNGSAIGGYAAVSFDSVGGVGSYSLVCPTCTSATVVGLTGGKPYVTAVLAYNANGWGDYAASGWVTPTS